MIDIPGAPCYFLGNNCAQGFHSYFEALYDIRTIRHLYILKGGPGTGKSSFMKAVARRLLEKRHSVEIFPCSSDPDSLDAVMDCETGIALVNGTPPHTLEAQYPGAFHSILNMGDHIDEEKIAPAGPEIVASNCRLKAHFARCTRCLTAARQLTEDNAALLAGQVQAQRLFALARRIATREFPHNDMQTGHIFHRFLTGVTPQGVIDLSDWTVSCDYGIYQLRDDYHIAPALLSALADMATACGLSIILCHDPLFPTGAPLQLVIPSLSLAFLTTPERIELPGEVIRSINLNRYLERHALDDHKTLYRFNRKLIHTFQQEAVESLAAAKAEHDVLESYYLPCVRFHEIDERRDDFIYKLLYL